MSKRILILPGDGIGPEIVAEAVKVLEMNRALHRDLAGVHARLARARLDLGDLEEAREAAESALRMNPDASRVAELVELIDRTREPPSEGELPQ